MRYDEPSGVKLSTWTAGCLQTLSMAVMLASPWWYGSASWEAHGMVFAAGIALGVLMVLHVVAAAISKEPGWWPSSLTWILFALGCFAFLQAQPRYPWEAPLNEGPASIQLQRWALGVANAPNAIADDLIPLPSSEQNATQGIPCGWESVTDESRKLAISVEPSTTRASAGSLFLAGLLVWVGNAVFARRGTYPILLVALTVLGSAIALFGILNVLMPATRGWLGLERANSFGTFVSKNSAGAFLNVSLAAAIGLVLWTSYQARKASERQRRRRHRNHLPAGWGNPLLESIRELIANLNASQIASFLALVLIAAAVLQSLSRGAAVSGLAAAAGTLALIVPGKRSGIAVLGALLIALAAMGFMVFFQMDERILTRLESLGEIDFESESRAGRIYIWDVSWKATQFYGWLGSGLGTFHYASLPFQRPSFSGWYYHAESIYMEVLVTLGILGGAMVLISLISVYRGLRRIYVSERFREFAPIQAAGFFLFFSQAIHSAVDFALILPGVHIPAAILLGAALGAHPESLRVLKKIKGRSLGRSETETPMELSLVRRLGMAAIAIAFASGGGIALYVSRNAAMPLGVAERIDRDFQRDDKLPVEERMEQRVETLVDRAAGYGISTATLNQSPQLLRLIGDSVCYDDRMKQWKARSTSADPKTAWNETATFLIRLALDRVDDSNREEWLESIGGTRRLDGLRTASTFYARSRAHSPLDWHALWGHIQTSIDCSAGDLIAYVPVLQRTSSHLPQLLTSASIFYNGQLPIDDRMRIWKIAIRTSPAASMGIARIMTAQYRDGQVPAEIFPDNIYYLYKLIREVFTKKTFPETHRNLCERVLKLTPALQDLPSLKKSLILADIASEMDDIDFEIENLSRYVQFKQDDVRILTRLIELQIRSKRWDDAEESLRKLKMVEPEHAKLKAYTLSIRSRSP